MEKYAQSEMDNNFYKFYMLEKKYKIVDFIRALKVADLNDLIVSVQEDTDGEMKSIEGTYQIDDLINNYNELMGQSLYPETVRINIHGELRNLGRVSIIINTKENKVSLVTNNEKLEVTDLIRRASSVGNS